MFDLWSENILEKSNIASCRDGRISSTVVDDEKLYALFLFVLVLAAVLTVSHL